MNTKLLKKDTQLYSSEEINTGKVWVVKDKQYPIYRKIIINLDLHTGVNNISHGIANFWFATSISGGVTLKNGTFQIFPESCCDDIVKFGISIRDISSTNLKILLGTGYSDTFSPAKNEAHLIIEYVKK